MTESPKYALVKSYYDRGLWSSEKVEAAIDKWITAEEAEIILTPPVVEEPEPEETTVIEPVEEENEPDSDEEQNFIIDDDTDPYQEYLEDYLEDLNLQNGESSTEYDSEITFLSEEDSLRGYIPNGDEEEYYEEE